MPPWETIAAQKREQRHARIPKQWIVPPDLLPSDVVKDVSEWPEKSGFFTDTELEITRMNAWDLLKSIASRQLTSLAVMTAFSKRACVAQQLLNCLTEINIAEALSRAEELDAILEKTGETVGPLHGLPVSLKDQFNMVGFDSSLGYCSWANNPSSYDATLVKMLKDAGAIPFVKTNVPQTLMMGETNNNIFGRTVNPYNRDLTPGGSSGGEGALIAFHGSPLGVGTDIGGSIRGPCVNSGLWGLRPSHGRVSYQRATNTYIGQEAIRSTAGPMCHSPADIRIFMKTLIDQKGWLQDPALLPIPWREDEEVLPKVLCFGYALHDGEVSLTPPLRRALEMTKTKLEAIGHKLIEYIPIEMAKANKLAVKFYTADGGVDFSNAIDPSGEPWLPEIISSWGGLLPPSERPTVADTWANQAQRQTLSTAWLERWQKTAEVTGTGRPIDGLIIPLFPQPAIPHRAGYLHGYSFLSPLLDLTTGVFPVTVVDEKLDVVPQDWEPISEKDKKVMEWYDGPGKFENSPVGLSITAGRLEEEKVVAMLRVVEEALQGR